MKRAMILGLLLLAIPVLPGCTEAVYSVGQPQALTESLRQNHWANEWNSIKEDYEAFNQRIEIFTADGELLLTITDNEEIFIFIRSKELDKWDYSLNDIPPDALMLCTIVGGVEHDGQMVTEAIEAVYYDQDGYYHLSETPGGAFQTQMTESAAHYLIELAGLEPTGTQRFAEHEFYDFGGSHSETGRADTYQTEMTGSSPPFVEMTYEGMMAASAEHRVEIIREGAVVQSISDNREVYEFLMSLDTSEWTAAATIPDSAVEVCTIVRHQLGRREFAGQMMEQSRLILYYDGSDYYMDSLISDNGSGAGDRFNTLYPQHFRVPAEVGDRLSE